MPANGDVINTEDRKRRWKKKNLLRPTYARSELHQKFADPKECVGFTFCQSQSQNKTRKTFWFCLRKHSLGLWNKNGQKSVEIQVAKSLFNDDKDNDNEGLFVFNLS